MLLHEGELRQAIRSLRVALELVADQPVGFGIDRRQWLRRGLHRGLRSGGDGTAPLPRRLGRRLRTADAGDELADDVAFFIGHGTPFGFLRFDLS